MKKIVLMVSSILIATDVPQAPVAPAKSTAQSRFEARKARADQKQAAKMQKYEARLEKSRKRSETKGLTPKTQQPVVPTSVEEQPVETETASSFSQTIESIFNSFVQTDTDKNLPIDPESYDVVWDCNQASLKSVIDKLEDLERQLTSTIQKAQSAKKSTKLVDKDLIEMGLTNIEAFADDSMEDVPYSGAKAAYKNRLQALANNISNVRAELF